ncbi:MAG TPA: hypothetical protein VEI06_03755 [Gemmatimonadaceae bacterium]|nr:hypothetical protein [Gemmatimonadaceae bacterium]
MPPGNGGVTPHADGTNPSWSDVARLSLRVAVYALFFLIVLEITTRLVDLLRFGMPMATRIASAENLLVRDATGMHGRPGAVFEQWRLNALGMRGPEVASEKPAGTLRVLVVGASETFGLYETPGREFPRQLEDTLRAALASGRWRPGCGLTHVEVLNGALPGMTMPTIAQDVRLRLGVLRPDLVVVYPTPAFYLHEDLPRAARPDSSGRSSGLPWWYALEPRSGRRVRDQLKQLTPSAVLTLLRRMDIAKERRDHPADWFFHGVPSDRADRFESDLGSLVGSVREVGAVPVLATHANAFFGHAVPDRDRLITWQRFIPRAQGTTLIAFDSAARARTIAVARESGAVLADIAIDSALTSSVRNFGDFFHFTDPGASRAAAVLAAAIEGECSAACCAAPLPSRTASLR